jgi:hypothetical protein
MDMQVEISSQWTDNYFVGKKQKVKMGKKQQGSEFYSCSTITFLCNQPNAGSEVKPPGQKAEFQ